MVGKWILLSVFFPKALLHQPHYQCCDATPGAGLVQPGAKVCMDRNVDKQVPRP